MAAPLNQRHVTAQEMVEQARRNRRQAAILESRSGPQQVAKLAARQILQPVSTGLK
jgi:hypothetical protein